MIRWILNIAKKISRTACAGIWSSILKTRNQAKSVVVIQTPNNNNILYPKHQNPPPDQEIDHESEPSDSSKKSAVQTVRPGAYAPVEKRCIGSLFHREGKVCNSDPNLRLASPLGAWSAGVPIIVPGLRSIR